MPHSSEGHAGQPAYRVAHRPGGEHLAAPRRLGHARRHVHDVADDVVLSYHKHLATVEADTQSKRLTQRLDQLTAGQDKR